MGVVVHHTASPARSTPGQQFQNDASYCAVGHQDAPVGNMVLGPDGELSVHAAGAANTQGKGGPWTTSRGTVPLDGGNSRLVAIEACNDGQGQVWNPAQCEAYAALVGELAAAYGFRTDRWGAHASDVLSHEEWTRPSCPGRKCDPAGPSPWSPQQAGGCSAGNVWTMDLFRAEVGTLPAPTPGGDDMPLTIFTVDGAGAAFLGFTWNGLGQQVEWLDTQAKLDTYRAQRCPELRIGLADCRNLYLLGAVPVGDHSHAWAPSDFRGVIDTT
jgi:hypothetical protein